VQRRLDEIMTHGWQEIRFDRGEVTRRMTEQRQAMARMVSWLGLCFNSDSSSTVLLA
jgi:hypothetical protein